MDQWKLTVWLPHKKFTLLYKATWDGFAAKNFHQKCDNKGPTITIIQSLEGKFLFGGYTAASWDSRKDWKSDPSAFIFTLSNPHQLPATKYTLNTKPTDNAIHCHPANGPCFGGVAKGACDIMIATNSNQNTHSCFSFPSTFTDTTGKGNKTFTGTIYFKTSEVEVYSVA